VRIIFRVPKDIGDIEGSFATAAKRLRWSSAMEKPKDGEEACGLKLHTGPKRQTAADSSDDDALLDEIWGARPKGGDADDDDGERHRKKKSRRCSTGSAASASAASASGSVSGPGPAKHTTKPMPSPSPNKKSAAGACKDMDLAEQVILACEQAMAHLADDNRLSSITPKSFAAVLARLNGRLAPDLVSTYSADYSGQPSETESRGMVILTKLRRMKEEMDIVKLVVDCFHATEGSDATAAALHQAVQAASKTNVKLANKKLGEMVVIRAVGEAVEAKDYDAMTQLLQHGEGTNEMGMNRLPAATAKDTARVIHPCSCLHWVGVRQAALRSSIRLRCKSQFCVAHGLCKHASAARSPTETNPY
jgi:hypothetical protein